MQHNTHTHNSNIQQKTKITAMKQKQQTTNKTNKTNKIQKTNNEKQMKSNTPQQKHKKQTNND